MRKRRTNADRLCDVLNDMGIRATNLGGTPRKPDKVRTPPPRIEQTRRRALKEIFRISDNAKRLTSK